MKWRIKNVYNERKIQLVKKIGAFFLCALLLIIGISVGIGIGSSHAAKEERPVKKEVVQKEKQLTPETVNKFLIAYYTKKDLGENRNRYKPLMTDMMYTQATSEEEQPVNQAYKGYVVNQVLDNAEIYLNQEQSSAICVVNYKNTQRTKLGTDKGALLNQTNKESIKLTFLKQGDKYLVNKIEPVTLTEDQAFLNSKNSYKDETTTESSEEVDQSESTVETTEQSTDTSHSDSKKDDKKTEETINGATK